MDPESRKVISNCPKKEFSCEWLERQTFHAEVAIVLGFIPVSSDTVDLRGGRWSRVEWSTGYSQATVADTGCIILTERDSAKRFSTSFIFHDSLFPKPLSIPLGAFQTFSKIRRDIHSSKLIPAANLPPVALKLVLDLRISPWIFEKIRNDPNVIFRGSGKDYSWKKPEGKNLVTLPF